MFKCSKNRILNDFVNFKLQGFHIFFLSTNKYHNTSLNYEHQNSLLKLIFELQTFRFNLKGETVQESQYHSDTIFIRYNFLDQDGDESPVEQIAAKCFLLKGIVRELEGEKRADFKLLQMSMEKYHLASKEFRRAIQLGLINSFVYR